MRGENFLYLASFMAHFDCYNAYIFYSSESSFLVVYVLFLIFHFLRNLRLIILKKVGKIGGDDSKVRSRCRHVLSCISKDIEFRVTEVFTAYFCGYECCLF